MLITMLAATLLMQDRSQTEAIEYAIKAGVTWQ